MHDFYTLKIWLSPRLLPYLAGDVCTVTFSRGQRGVTYNGQEMEGSNLETADTLGLSLSLTRNKQESRQKGKRILGTKAAKFPIWTCHGIQDLRYLTPSEDSHGSLSRLSSLRPAPKWPRRL